MTAHRKAFAFLWANRLRRQRSATHQAACRALWTGTLALALGACSALPDKPVRSQVYDLGPGVLQVTSGARTPGLPPLAFGGVEAPGTLDGTGVLYRLGYANPLELRSYGLARWSMPPAELLAQRLRQTLAQRTTVVSGNDAGDISRLGQASGAARWPRLLRVELDEFSHLFQSPAASTGLVRLRVTLTQPEAVGQRLLAQRVVLVQRPAPSADAAGGVAALASASDAAIEEIMQWLASQP